MIESKNLLDQFLLPQPRNSSLMRLTSKSISHFTDDEHLAVAAGPKCNSQGAFSAVQARQPCGGMLMVAHSPLDLRHALEAQRQSPQICLNLASRPGPEPGHRAGAEAVPPRGAGGAGCGSAGKPKASYAPESDSAKNTPRGNQRVRNLFFLGAGV